MRLAIQQHRGTGAGIATNLPHASAAYTSGMACATFAMLTAYASSPTRLTDLVRRPRLNDIWADECGIGDDPMVPQPAGNQSLSVATLSGFAGYLGLSLL